jgi:hypothetical protein
MTLVSLRFSRSLKKEADKETAIWDNRSTYHTAIYHYDGKGLSIVQYCVGIGQHRYFDPTSKSKREAEGSEGDQWNLA